MKFTLIAAAVLTITLYSCQQKKEDVTPDSAKVAITINSPSEGQTFRKGDTVYMNAIVNYISEMHGYDISLTNTDNNTLLYEDDEHVHTDNFNIANYWVDTLSTTTNIQLKLSAEIDHEGHEATKTISFKSTP